MVKAQCLWHVANVNLVSLIKNLNVFLGPSPENLLKTLAQYDNSKFTTRLNSKTTEN